jgi:biopolymer transport protein ExbB
VNPFSIAALFIKEGGPFMYVILSAAVVITAISVERFIVIGRAAALNSRKLLEDLVRSASRGDFITARNICMSSNAPVAMVAAAILRVGAADEATLQAAADDAATIALPPLTRRLSHLAMMANVATLLGLLGTIFGLITSFSSVSAADPSQRSSFLAMGISQALNTTAFGLIIAVPTLLIHGYLVGLVEAIVEQVDEATIRLTQVLSQASAGSTRAPLRAVNAANGGAAQPAAGTRVAPAQGGAQ